MKKLTIYEGGHPFSNDDINYLQDAYTEAISNLTKIYGTTYILHGLNRTSTTVEIIPGVPVPAYQYSAGWVVVNNEPCYFQEQTILEANYNTAYISTASEDDGDPVLYDDSISKPIYFKRRAFISASSGTMLLSDFDKLRVARYDWITVGGGGAAPAFEAGWGSLTSPTIPLRFRHNHGGVEFSGGCYKASSIGTTATLLFTLPELYRPKYATVLSIVINDNTDRNHASLIINTTGEVYVRADSGSALTTVSVRLDGVRFPLD